MQSRNRIIIPGHAFKDPALLERALTHSSVGRANNERLEFLGDALLGVIIAEAVYMKFPEANEGALTRVRAQLIKRDTLSRVAQRLGIGEHVRLGHGERKSGVWRRSSILADTLEALFGAVYLDAGFARCRDCILEVYQPLLEDIDADRIRMDAKTRLQEYLPTRGLEPPMYTVLTEFGPPHERVFEVQCKIESLSWATVAKGRSKCRAEQGAAELALKRLHTAGEKS